MKKLDSLFWLASGLCAVNMSSCASIEGMPNKIAKCDEGRNFFSTEGVEEKLDKLISCENTEQYKGRVCDCKELEVKDTYPAGKAVCRMYTPKGFAVKYISTSQRIRHAVWVDGQTGDLYGLTIGDFLGVPLYSLKINTPCGDSFLFYHPGELDEDTFKEREKVVLGKVNDLRAWMQGRDNGDYIVITNKDDPEFVKKGVENIKWGKKVADKLCGKLWDEWLYKYR